MSDVTVKVILSYPNIITPRQPENAGEEPKYTTVGLIHETSPEFPIVKKAFDDLKVAMGWQPHQNCAFRDCRLPSPKGKPPKPELAGYWSISTSTKVDRKPDLVDMNRQPIIDSSKVYPGAEAYLVFNPYSYPGNGGGITAGLNGVAITGEMGALGRLDNRPSVDQMFAAVPGGATPGLPAGAAAPAPPGGPAAALVRAPVNRVMLPAANGATYDAMIQAGWTNETLVSGGMMQAETPPVAAPPVAAPPVAAPPVAAPPTPGAKVMLTAANGATYEDLIKAGWTDDLLVTNNMMQA